MIPEVDPSVVRDTVTVRYSNRKRLTTARLSRPGMQVLLQGIFMGRVRPEIGVRHEIRSIGLPRTPR
jgi:hypothetical protein